MCGVLGVWDFKNKININEIKKMIETISHRGPDDEGIYFNPTENIVLAHRRLSILDLTKAGHQPMKKNNGVIVYNGEVYNFKEIRKDLEKKCNFLSNSDTEVVLESYLEWGIESFKKLRGMFAFGIFDEKEKKLILVRDRIGVKPLYYYFDGNLFIFSSELKSIIFHPKIKKELDFEALYLFFELGYIPAPYSIFKKIKKLEPGSYLIIEKNRKIEIKKYWDIYPFFLNQNKFKKEEEVEERLEEILTESFKLRMIADVEVGHFLSGGIDSSTVAAILVKKLGFKLKTFTIGFYEKKYNEAIFAKRIAEYLNTEHNEYYCTTKEAKEIIFKLPKIYDEPFGDYSGIPTYLLSKIARQKVKVALSADGGDEAFCGYSRYWRTKEILDFFRKYPFIVKFFLLTTNFYHPFLYEAFFYLLPKKIDIEKYIQKFKKIFHLNNYLIPIYRLLRYEFWQREEILKLLKLKENFLPLTFFEVLTKNEIFKNLDEFSVMQLIDYKTYLPDDILVKVDRATMSVSLEGRDPFLDHKLVEYVASLPSSFKYKNKTSKYVLRKILYKYIPKELIERPKQGFTIPLENWLRGDLKFLIEKYLDTERIKKEGLFDWKIIEEKKKRFLKKKINPGHEIWLLIVFEMWKEIWFN